MERTIKFRGKNILTDKWVYGDLLHLGNACAIVTSYEEEELEVNPISDRLEFRVEDIAGVYPQTVGQFTGLLDKNGKEIYEGDVIEIKEIGGYGCKRKGVVEYDVDDCAFVVRVLPPSWAGTARLSTRVQICADWNCTHKYINQYTVIGNIHDNPEQLKTETL